MYRKLLLYVYYDWYRFCQCLMLFICAHNSLFVHSLLQKHKLYVKLVVLQKCKPFIRIYPDTIKYCVTVVAKELACVVSDIASASLLVIMLNNLLSMIADNCVYGVGNYISIFVSCDV